jgi:Tfp pilus assembly protein PilO
MNLTKSRTIVLLGSLGIVLLLIVSWFLLLSPRMATASDLNTQRESVEAQNVAAESKIAELEQMKANIGEVKAEADLLTKRFPPTAEEAELFALVKKAAAQAGIPERNISDLTIAVPAIGAGDGSVTLPETAPPAEGETAADPNAAPAEAAPVAAAPTSQLASMPLDVTVTGTKVQVTNFLAALENMDRAYLVSSVSLGGEGEGEGSSATINGSMYLLPELVDPTAEVPTEGTDGAVAGEPGSVTVQDRVTTYVDADGNVWTRPTTGVWSAVGPDGAPIETEFGDEPPGFVETPESEASLLDQ